MSKLLKMHDQIRKTGRLSINVTTEGDLIVMKLAIGGQHSTDVKLDPKGAIALAKSLVEACAFVAAEKATAGAGAAKEHQAVIQDDTEPVPGSSAGGLE